MDKMNTLYGWTLRETSFAIKRYQIMELKYLVPSMESARLLRAWWNTGYYLMPSSIDLRKAELDDVWANAVFHDAMNELMKYSMTL